MLFRSAHTAAFWPKAAIGDKVYCMSAVAAALTAYNDAGNADVPYESPSNKDLRITGTVLEDGTEVELRLLAHISGDEAMQQAFLSGQDFHTLTAAKVFHVAPEEVTSRMRSSAKAVNFGIVYGISAFSLAQDIGVSVAEAKEYMERYFDTYRGVKRYMEQVVETAREKGYVKQNEVLFFDVAN